MMSNFSFVNLYSKQYAGRVVAILHCAYVCRNALRLFCVGKLELWRAWMNVFKFDIYGICDVFSQIVQVTIQG